jgi:hypothetical protein
VQSLNYEPVNLVLTCIFKIKKTGKDSSGQSWEWQTDKIVKNIWMELINHGRRRYRFSVYSLASLLLALTVFLVLVFLPILFFDTKKVVAQWPEALVKGALILFIVAFVAIVRHLVSVSVQASLDVNGFSLEYLSAGRFLTSRRDQLVLWHEISSWKMTEEHASGHSWSPAEFSLSMNDGRTIKLLLSDREAFEPFLLDFQRHVAAFNVKHSALAPIRSGAPNPKRSALLILFIFFPAGCFMLWEGYRRMNDPTEDIWNVVLAFVFGVLSLVLCGFMGRVFWKKEA